MGVSNRFILEQGPVLASLARTAIHSIFPTSQRAAVPGPELHDVLPARSPELVRAYLRHVGGDPSAYKKTLPPHLFPQWMFPLAARTLEGIPYPLTRVLNGGCRLEIRAPIPQGRPLYVSARLESIDDDGRRAVLHQRTVTGTSDCREALVAHLYAIVPAAKSASAQRAAPSATKERPRVPDDATELARFALSRQAGLQFAKLTGDFNPVHWLTPYAQSLGFRSTILHGFATMARTYEAIVRSVFCGNVQEMRTFDVRFVRPLLLPKEVGVYVSRGEILVGGAAGGPAYLTGNYEGRLAVPAHLAPSSLVSTTTYKSPKPTRAGEVQRERSTS